MKFQKKINNSVAWVINEENEKVIAMGKGISFGRKTGEEISREEIERIFTPETQQKETNVLYQAIENISDDVLLLTEEISEQASKTLNIEGFDDSHYLALADHLNYALKRSSQDTLDYPENLRWEVKKLYPQENEVAIDALYTIEKKTGIRLPKSEQTFLTYHFVNAQYDAKANIHSSQLATLINRAIEIIEYHYQMTLDQNSVNYIRFNTHLRYFILRQLNQEKEPRTIDEQLIEVVKINYRKVYQAAEKVGKMIEAKQGAEVNNDELFYLTLHINRVTERQN
ncbi:PRD domain-containing protein [Tetragenococcus koreensis]|uniref:PRD domain-containing protein n=1 Tax=Tetragenococcus koreensis TaxID=290335 RepID=UPI001F17D507|nr:PRD domain-containing protein [Tetragenococcus koreensis]MDN6281307.1 PRD domain-containing protein [Psychroflexus sp.]MCF1618178.1 PRD domain-containing protein [Tetragenococcus koreensis]MCF1619779.1 PRD domain-containing protein [Tetragenococcus koreensis]MCF1622794.1 PRD domain-containing protein [Tetragenococcus koreensis]MCF1632819.1 PRD domain-containing protein [Tetragenococcus koreensis]